MLIPDGAPGLVTKFPDEILSCPRCQSSIESDGKRAYACPHCGHVMPVLGDVPWIHHLPEASLWQWRNALGAELDRLRAQQEKCVAATKNPAIAAATRQRLLRLAQAYAEQAPCLETLLAPMTRAAPANAPGFADAMATRLPLSQTLSIYAQTLFRDWAWETGEADALTRCVRSCIPTEGLGDKLLVLGSGASRLAWDLHQSINSIKSTVALDHNPLLALAAAKITSGRKVKLHEFPRAPLDHKNSGIMRTCAAPADTRPGMHFLLADGLNPPLREESVTAVLTPWFIDIVPRDPRLLARSINRLLANGGVWINSGTHVFESGDELTRFLPEELREIFAAEGFAIEQESFDEIVYLKSPASCHGRLERIWTFRARKVRTVDRPTPHVNVPDWLMDLNKPVPELEYFRGMQRQWGLWAELSGQVDGKTSIAEAALNFGKKYGLPDADALGSAVGFFGQLYEESRRAGR